MKFFGNGNIVNIKVLIIKRANIKRAKCTAVST